MTTLVLVFVLTLTAYVSAQSCSGGQMTDALRKKMLGIHNDDRSSVALGRGKGSPYRAKNMYKLSWDCELEQQAQYWASRCVYGHSPDDWRNAGENIWTQYSTAPLPIGDSTLIGATNYWWNELEKYGIIDSSYKYSSAMSPIGHWTQMAWANTTKLGCGVASCPWMKSGYKHNSYVVCQYRSPGNYRGSQIYEFGNGCSRDSDCTLFAGSKCESQSSLCIAPGDTSVVVPPKPTAAPDGKPKPKPGNCRSNVMTEALRESVLKTHNNGRYDLSMGRVGNRRTAKNVYKLSYDCGLESQAQAYADQCDIEAAVPGNMYYDASKGTAIPAGEALQTAMNKWWDAIKTYSLRDNVFSRSTSNKLYSFTQMVWGKTTKVGCGVKSDCQILYEGKYYTGAVTVCMYQERGNIFGRNIYEYGNPCWYDSDCTTFSGSKCDQQYRLCVAP